MGSIAIDAPQHTEFDVDSVLEHLQIDEKIALISGSDAWHTASIPRLGIPKVRLTDGPNGVRGTKFFNGIPAACLPCGTALAATWDINLIQQCGILQANEALAKGASVILGPTVNMQRSPLGGRGFESYSEDPVLSGNLSAATIKGIQSRGVAATIKHFVCNDQEHERQSMDAIVSERALREIYLMPFQIAERDARPMCYMTSYNKVNGVHAGSSKILIDDILRKQWGFRGLVISDWFGTYSTVDAIKAGLDLEMPGPSYIRGHLVKHALGSGRLHVTDLDNRVREVLKLIKAVVPLNIPEDASEHTRDTPATAALLRRVAGDGIVLLKNDNKTLPFKKDRSTAVIGPNAAFATYCGGGSASIVPYYAITPLDGIRNLTSNVQYELGAPGWKKLPLLSDMVRRSDGKQGLDATVYLTPPSNTKRRPVDSFPITSSDIFLADYKNHQIDGNLFYMDIDGTLIPDETAEYEFSLSVSGTGKLFIDGECIIDNMTKQTAGESFFGSGTIEEMGSMKLEKGRSYHIHISFGTLPTRTFTVPGSSAFDAGGLRAGFYRKLDMQKTLDRAVALAKSVDQVVLCVGLNRDWESEGYDRTHMDLPPGTDELIFAITSANPNTVVVNQSGTPVTMPWLRQTPALLQAWYGGNETGNAIADIIFGDRNPSGKLPLSFPIRNEDNPAFLNYRSDGGKTIYGEGVFIGYRFYEKTKREVAFPFGHGLSYTNFAFENLTLDQTDNGEHLLVKVEVLNEGPSAVDGMQVVQVYVAPQSPSVTRPIKELKGFTKVFVPAGGSANAQIKIAKKYACSFWDERADAWVQEKGTYTVLVGDSSANTPLSAEFEVSKTSWWNGL